MTKPKARPASQSRPTFIGKAEHLQQAVAWHPQLAPEADDRQTLLTVSELVNPGLLVGSRPSDAQHLGCLGDSQDGGEVIQVHPDVLARGTF